MNKLNKLIILLVLCFANTAQAEDGSRLWLRTEIPNDITLKIDPTMPDDDGYRISGHIVTARNKMGLLYGKYALLRGEQGESHPFFKLRILNHWDNLDGTIERGYAGNSIFWEEGNRLSTKERKALIEKYAEACASIGINGTVLNNVNASPKMLTRVYIEKVKEFADILRPWGIRVYLSVNFGSPKALGDLKTADPLNAQVRHWWEKKAKEIFEAIPDFGGFLVKANSEGQPGPFDYGRTHADGANMLADALKPYGGIVMWRSFVYDAKHHGEDRVKQAVSEFAELDGKFRDNVILQSKNGPLDFQPREPYAPIFDHMNRTQQMAELQITQEYLGQSKHLVYLAPMWKEFFSFVKPDKLVGIAGVANIGLDKNWCGHHFSQANWYAFGRLAWNPMLSSEQIAVEWIEQTFGQSFVPSRNTIGNLLHYGRVWEDVCSVMLRSHEACVDYMMPLGLHHIFKFDHHMGPDPGGFKADYPIEWCPIYYHRANKDSVGVNRSSTGTNATGQYREPYCSQYNEVKTCPEEYLLWFHRIPWTYHLKSGRTLWEELQYHYNHGVSEVDEFVKIWQQVKPYIDEQRWQEVSESLRFQQEDARLWRDVCLEYFGQFGASAKLPLSAWGDQGDGTYANPVLNADFSDPDVIRVGEKFYMVASDFHFMGMQVLESDDMVNWRYISQIYKRMDEPGWNANQHYGGGSWAPAIRYHDGRFFVYFCTPDEGLYMTTATDARGPWEPLHLVKRVRKWEDPCPLWDDDGQAYLGRSQHGAGPIIVHKMSADGRQLLDEGTTVYTGPVAEGTKWLKRNGYYFLIIPEGGVGTGWQTVLRSTNIYGPYERRIVLEQGTTAINGPHQGALVDAPDGSWWFYHFQDTPELGRVVHLQPARWVVEWPLMGIDKDGNGIGEPVRSWQKPIVSAGRSLLQTDDDFSATLGLQWQWNHNPDDEHWSLTDRKGFLTIHALPATALRDCRNMLTQKVMGYVTESTAVLEARGNCFAGLACTGSDFHAVGITPKGIFVEKNEQRTLVRKGSARRLYLRVRNDCLNHTHQFFYSLDGRKFQAAGEPFPMHNGHWKGIRVGLFCYGENGTAQFDSFSMQENPSVKQ